MSLSDKRTPIIANFGDKSKIVSYTYPEKDVKQAVQKLIDIGNGIDLNDIKKIFGEELCEVEE